MTKSPVRRSSKKSAVSDAVAVRPAWSKRSTTASSWSEMLVDQQRLAYQFVLAKLRDGGGVGLFSEQGTGKTIISMAVLGALRPRLVLIVAPLTALDVTWRERLRTLYGEAVTSDYSALQRHRRAGRPCVLLIHYQALTKLRTRLSRIPWDLVIIDEMHRAKARGSGWSRAVRMLRGAKRRLGLSGTPIDKSPIDVWAQMRFIDSDVLGDRWQDFAAHYCYRTGYMGKEWRFLAARLTEFLRRLDGHIYRLSASFLELPPVEVIPVPVSMFGRQRRLYDEMASTGMIRELGLKADRAITRKIKLEQLAGGFVIDESDEVHDVGAAKERKLAWLIKQLDAPIVVSCKYLEDLARIKKRLVQQFDEVALLYGAVPKDDRTTILKKFQAGDIDALALQVRTGSESIEFTRARDLIIYSMGHSFIDWSQVIARLQRYGQTRPVRVWLIYVLGTVDEDIIDNVYNKGKQAYEVVSYFEEKNRWQKKQ